MRIDAHQHFWRYHAADYGWIDDSMAVLRRDFLPPESAREMSTVQFDSCIAVQARQTDDETRWLLELASRHASIAGVVGWLDLQQGAERLRQRLASYADDRKLVGIRHIVQAEPDDRFLVRPQVLEGLSILAEFSLPFDLLIYPRHLDVAVECVGRLPQQRFMLDHLAKPNIRDGEMTAWRRGIRALAAQPNVFAKLSGLVTEADWHFWTPQSIRPYLDVAFDAFGWERLIIGSDWPVCLVAGDYSRTMHVVLDYLNARPLHEQTAVAGGNAERFWRLKRDAHIAPGAGTAAVRGGM
jgi:L-fucono-1,5-lactonase